jgi:MBG domain (YGX type)/Bacterial Ig-like domain (group 3)/Galactose oxidase, central domain
MAGSWITGGRDAASNLVAASEIFDPETQTSSASASLNTARVDHSVTLLADGRVLITGGSDDSGPLSSAEIFDPAHSETGFVTVGSAMSAARTRHTATLLNDGHVLIAGGDAQGSAELFDATTGTFMPTIWPLTVARSGHTATLFTDDSVLLAGGNTATMETYRPNQGFTLDPATMSVVRTGHWAFELSDTRLLLFQGDTGNTIDESNPGTGTITPKGTLDFHASSSSLLANGKVLVLGTGVSGLYDPNAVPPAPDFTAFDENTVPNSGILPRSGQAAVELPSDKKILITGGADGNNQLLGQALFNPARIWTDKDDYHPDVPVILSGSGWKANEPVYLFAVDNETEQWTYEMTVNADSNGEFVLSPYFIVELRHQGVQFHVTAVSQSAMQADVYFTDTGANSVTVGAQVPNPLAAGNSATYPVTLGFNGSQQQGSCTVTLSASGLPAGATASFNPNPITASSPRSLPSTLTITTTGAVPNGTYNFTVTGARGANCQGGGNDPTASAQLVVGGAAATTTSVTSSSPTSTYGNSVTFTATVSSGSGTPTGSVTFYEGACGGTALAGPVTLNGSGQASFSTSSFTAGLHTIRACYTPSGSFQPSNGTVSQTVQTRSVTVTADAKSKNYGDTDPALTYQITSGSLAAGDSFTGALTRVAGENVGTYAIQQGTLALNSNYALTFVGANLTITSRNLTVTADAKTKIYGASDPALTYTHGALSNGDTDSVFTGSLTRAPGENVGTYAISHGTLSAGSNYNILFTGANFTITARDLTVTAAPKSKMYGDSDPALTYTHGALFNGDTDSVFTGSLSRAPGENVGTYAITQGTLSAGSNYNILFTGANLTITPRDLTVTADPGTKIYGASDPALTYTHSALFNGDTDSVFTGSLTRAPCENVGTYAITQGTLSAGSNYNILFTGANFTITPRDLTVTTDPKTKIYGASDPALTYTHGMLYNGDTDSVFTGSLSRASGESVGTYAITQGTLSAGSNYNILFTGANVTITPRDLTVTANAGTKIYGASEPALTYTHGMLYNGDTNSVFTGSLTRVAGENVGTYAITQGTLSAGSNYNILFTGANFTITPRDLTVTAGAKTKGYGNSDPALTYTHGPLYNGDTDSVFTGALTRVAGENVGTYAITQGTLSAGSNYNILSVGANFTITPKPATVTAVDKSKAYLAPNPTPTATVTGTVNGDTLNYTLRLRPRRRRSRALIRSR